MKTSSANHYRSLLTALTVLLLTGVHVNGGAFSAWTHRMTITFTGYDKPETLTDFPVLVVLSNNVNGSGFDYAGLASSVGNDLRFAASNETTELNYEIEHWDTNGVSFVWVQMPELVDTNSLIYAYWGNALATQPSYTTNGAVWDANYVGVWHLSETDARDSTTNAFHGTASGAVAASDLGMVDGAVDTSIENHIAVPDHAAFTLGSQYSVSAWIKSDPVSDYEGFVGTYDGAGFIFSLHNTSANSLGFWAAGTWCWTSTTIPDNEWKHVAYTANGSDGRFYVDGVQVASVAAVAVNNGGDLHLGSGGPSWAINTRRYDGLLDEVRVSNVQRGTNWIWASWINQASNTQFLTYSDAGPVSTVLAVSALPPTGIGPTYATLNGRVLQTGEAENPAVYICWAYADAGTNSGTSVWTNVEFLGTNWGRGESFSTNLTGLIAGSNYTYRCYVTNSTGEAWSENARSFTTITLPSVENDGIAWIRRHQARLAGTLTDDGGEPSKVWAQIWRDGGSTTSSVSVGTFLAQSFSLEVGGLDVDTVYHFRFGASNVAGAVWSAADSFTTLTGDPIEWYVATNGLATTGTDWATAFQDVAAALTAADPGDTIYMAGQTVWLTNAVSLTAITDLVIRGGYAATNALDQPGPWDPDRWPTVLQRDPAVRTRIMDITSSTNLYLRGLEFRDGHPNHNEGGGLRINGSSGLTFERCRWVGNLAQKIVDHSAGSGGGAHIVNAAGVRFDACRFDANNTLGDSHHSRGLGGGLYLANSTVSVSNSVFSANRARTTGGNSSYAYGYGGAIYLASGTLDVHRSVIHSNDTMSGSGGGTMPTRGGGLYVAGGTARLENVLVATNATRSTNAQGCGLHQAGGALHLLNVTVADNLREGIRRAAGTLTITNSIFWHNGVKDMVGQQNVFVAFSAVETGKSDPAIAHGWQGCVTNAPRFFDKTYYHLASEHGVYQGGFFSGGAWHKATETSPLIDAGDPAMPVVYEPRPHGGIINLGAYGNTPLASKSPPMQVINLSVTDWDEQSVILGAQVVNIDSPPLYARFYYGLSDGGTDPDAWDAGWDAGEVTGWPWTISARIEGLLPGSNYVATCRIENVWGNTVWGTPVSLFTPVLMLPIVENVGVLNDQGPSVTLQAEMRRPGSAAPPPDTWFVWGPDPAPNELAAWPHQVAMGPQTGAFATVIATQPGLNYWFTTLAVNSRGTNWADAAIPFGNDVIRFVDTAAQGNRTGYNWPNAFTRLQDALAACRNDRTNILYLKGGDGGTFRATVFEPQAVTAAHVRVFGGYAGLVVNGPGPRDPVAWPTVLTREGTVELTRPLLISGANDVWVSDVTLTGGDPRGSGGGGLRIQTSANVAISGCRIVSNLAAIAADHTSGMGGGAYVVNSTNVVIADSLVAWNESLGNSHHSRGLGGGLYVENSTVAVSASTILNNRARTTGGNSGYAWGFGGGVYVQSGTLDIRQTLIQSNRALSGWDPGTGSMSTRGAGLYIAGGTARLQSVLIATNASMSSTAQGSGLHQAGGTLRVVNTTVIGNRQEGIRRVAGTVSVTNSIVWGHPNGDLINFPEDGGVLTTVGYTLIGDGQNDGINGCLSDDPLFVDAAVGDYRLRTRYGRPGLEEGTWIHDAATSPAIDAGLNLGNEDDTRDLDGQPRRRRGRFENQVATVDLGAYEQTARSRGSVITVR